MQQDMGDNIQSTKRGNIEIKILKDACISAGPCVVYAPNTFDLDEKGKATIKDCKWDDFDKIVEAAKSCPVFAIEIYKDGKKIYPEN